MSLSWDMVVDHALALPDTALATYYGGAAVKANDRPIVTGSREADSFCLHLARDTVQMLMTIGPDTFWQTPHYQGYPAVLVRYAGDRRMILDQIAASRDWAVTRPKPRPRSR